MSRLVLLMVLLAVVAGPPALGQVPRPKPMAASPPAQAQAPGTTPQTVAGTDAVPLPRPKPGVTTAAAAPSRSVVTVTPTPAPVVQAALTRQVAPSLGPGRAGSLDPGEGAACEAALAKVATFELAPAISEKSCGAPRVLAVTAVGAVSLSRTARLRCPVAAALAEWTRDVVQPAARTHMRQELKALKVSTTYHCRTRRNGRKSTRLSEHAFANAVDIMGFEMADGSVVEVAPRHARNARAFQREVRAGACKNFATVIGPGQAHHDDHFHLDTAPRRGGYVVCQ